jgi:cysteine desulfurase/selenocysteine lyase
MATDPLRELAGWQAQLRSQFPIIAGHPEVAFLDSAATSQKPAAVLAAVQEYLTTRNANVARGSYPWANATTAMVEHAGSRVRGFLADPDPTRSGVHFVSGASEGLRRVAHDWLAGLLTDGDEILVPHEDHQANLLPWLELRDRLAATGVRIRVLGLPYDPASGDYDHRALPALVGERTRFVAATHVHHVFGADMNVYRIRAVVGPEIPICLDAAQSVGHQPVDVSSLDVDFVVFSGHKSLALPGTGVIWAANRRGPAFGTRGWDGTPNTVGFLSLATALDWLEAAGLDRIERWTTALMTRLTDALSQLADLEILGCQRSLRLDSEVQRRTGIVSFRHRMIPSDDLGFILAAHGLLVRADHHCQAGTDRAMDRSVRVSVHVYNTPDEIDRLVNVLSQLAKRGG